MGVQYRLAFHIPVSFNLFLLFLLQVNKVRHDFIEHESADSQVQARTSDNLFVKTVDFEQKSSF